jgi:leucyl aminopeptidase
MALDVSITRSAPRAADVIGVPVGPEGPVPRALGLNRNALSAHGFEGRSGQTLVVPSGSGPVLVAVGVGPVADRTPSTLRDAAAAFARAAGRRRHLATALADVEGVPVRAAAQSVVEGVRLATHRYDALKSKRVTNGADGSGMPTALTLVVSAAAERQASAGASTGADIADAVCLARDFANMPHSHLNAAGFAERAVEIGSAAGLGVEVFDEDALAELGCHGLLAVNAGSDEAPRMVRLSYRPRNAVGHIALVGKGVMYDSGGISLKPSDPMHAMMKMDMTGAAVVLAVLSSLKALRCRTAVTGYLMCTDNMPSGTAMRLGDVITYRNGTTVEVHNTDAEGRLILADGLILAAESAPDAIVDIATLTGACMAALGQRVGGVLGNDQALVDRLLASSARTDESLWQLPLERRYRKLLDSQVADMRNIGGPYAGAITAALFLAEFVGDVPWAHLDIAGPMHADADDGWLTRGATAFGTRLLIDLVTTHGGRG